MRKKPTVKDLFELKGKRQLTQVFVENTDEARASEEAGIDMIVVMGDVTKACREVAPTTFITGAISYGECASPTEAIRRGFQIWDAGADAIYASCQSRRCEAITQTSHQENSSSPNASCRSRIMSLRDSWQPWTGSERV